MNQILAAEHDIKEYLYENYDTQCNFVLRQSHPHPRKISNEYALQLTTRDGSFNAMKKLVESLNIPFTTSKDNAFLHCIILKNSADILKIASNIKEVKI